MFAKDRRLTGLAKAGMGVIVLALLLAISGTAQHRNALPRPNPSTSTQAEELVWPLPPAAPRIRWLSQVHEYADVRGKKEKKKLSWFERVAGVKEKEDAEETLSQPYGIAVDSRGRMFVADGLKHALVVFDLNGKRVEEWGGGRAPFALPVGVAVDAQDRVFVSDAQARAVSCFQPDGKLVARFGYEELQRPAGLAVDKEKQLLYVADARGHRISVYDLKSLALVQHIGGPSGDGKNEGYFHTPTNVAVGGNGYLYVTDSMNRRVQVFDRRWKFRKVFGQPGDSPGSFAMPKGIAVDSEGHVYVVDARFNNFQIFDQDGQPLLFVGASGREPGQFTLAAGIHIDAQDRIYVTDFTGRVQIFQYVAQPTATTQRR